MSFQSSQVANFFIEKGLSENMPVTTLKLMKIVYIAHGWGLSVLNRDILGGESVEAWQHGPVIPSLYHAFKHFGSSPITSLATEFEFLDMDDDLDNFNMRPINPRVDISDHELIQVLDFVWGVYKQYSGFDLVNMTHQQGSPWSDSYQAGARHVKIENGLIKNFYEAQVRDLLHRAS